jgi:hypothetical protein
MPPEGMQDKNCQRGTNCCKRSFDIEDLIPAQLRAGRSTDPEEFQDRPHRYHKHDTERRLRDPRFRQPIPDPLQGLPNTTLPAAR